MTESVKVKAMAQIRMAKDAIRRAETGVGGSCAIVQLAKAEAYLKRARGLLEMEYIRGENEELPQ